MSDKVKAVKIKYDDGSYSESIPIGVSVDNVQWDGSQTLKQKIDSLRYSDLNSKPLINGVELTNNTTIPVGTSSYNGLSNKPSINGVELVGDKTSTDLGIVGSGGTGNYNELSNKPKINNVELTGNRTFASLGLNNVYAQKSTTLSGYGITNAYTKSEVDTQMNKKVNLPVDSNNQPINGINGQVLYTKGNGQTGWRTIESGSGSSGSSTITIDETLTIEGAAADAQATGQAISKKINLPVDNNNRPINGVSGQVLYTKGNGQTGWINLSDSGATVTEVEILLGNTPYTITENDEKLKLVSQGTTSYQINNMTIIDLQHNDGITYTNVTLSKRDDGRNLFTATGDSSNECYIDLTVDNLIIGNEYTFIVERGAYQSGFTGGYWELFNANNESLGTIDVTQDSHSLNFTASTTSIRIHMIPVRNYYWDTYNLRSALNKDFRLITSLSGSFSNSIVFNNILPGAEITTTPISEVYKIEEKQDTTVDTDFDINSTNPIQNRKITETLGNLSDLVTTTKSNLVGAINEASMKGWINGVYAGTTPYTLEKDQYIRLESPVLTSYSILGGAIASYTKNNGIIFNNVTVQEIDDKIEFTATGNVWNECYVDIEATGLTIGSAYTFTVTSPLERGTTGGYFVISDSNETELAFLDVGNYTSSVQFTSTTTDITIRLYPVKSYYWETYNIRKAIINTMEVQGAASGTFTGLTALGKISEKLTITSNPVCQVYTFNASSSIISPLEGKKCVFLGDSVSAFHFPPDDIPSIVGEKTGMTVFNCAFGGCRISDTVTEDGYKAFSFVKIVDAILSGDWSLQDENVGVLQQNETAYSAADHLASLKSIDWSTIDYLVIHWAGNDPGSVRMDDPNNDENTSYYLGAFRYCVRKLQTAYKQLKLLYVNCTYHERPNAGTNTDDIIYTIDNKTYHYYDWGDAIIEESKLLKLPTLDLYRTSCINKETISYYMTEDMTHPNLVGNKLIAGKIAAKLLSEYS